MSELSIHDLKSLFLKNTPLIDVRAPVEFRAGTLPGAVNLPLMNDEERAAVGTAYKQSGSEEALRLGHRLVSGTVKESRVRAWTDFISEFPEAVIFCFRGGLRSRISRDWLRERGVDRPLIEGGYKKARQFLIHETATFSARHSFLLLSGPTGSAKTEILRAASVSYPAVDLEALACHRGSAFGAVSEPQPSQIDFENSLAQKLLGLGDRMEGRKLLVEDESRLIGRCAIPEAFFLRMRESELLYLEEPFETRVENIFRDYILKTPIASPDPAAGRAQFAKYRSALMTISRKLGGLKTREVLENLAASEERYLKNPEDLGSNRIWIGQLLASYYDPMYARSLERQNPRFVRRGNAAEILDYLRSLS